jgi:molybdenum cofactor guanylyltransferase
MLDNVTAALIAGGKSTRFGSPKLLAEYRNKRLFDHALDLALTISRDTIIVGTMEPDSDLRGLPVYKDLVSGCGPLCGIYTALKYAKHDYVAILPVDMPLLSVNIYRYLYPNCTKTNPVVALSHKGLEPMVSIWPVSMIAEIEKCIKSKGYHLYKMLKRNGARELDLQTFMPGYKEEWFENINYKQELHHLIKNDKTIIPSD